MLVNMKKFETNSFLANYQLTCIGKTKLTRAKTVSYTHLTLPTIYSV